MWSGLMTTVVALSLALGLAGCGSPPTLPPGSELDDSPPIEELPPSDPDGQAVTEIEVDPGQSPGEPPAAETTPEEFAPIEELLESSARASAGGYRLYPGDTFRFQVHDNPDLEMSGRVPTSGPVVFPLVGPVEVTGRTIAGVTDELTAALEADYLTRAQVQITIQEYAERRAYIIGAVDSPGAYGLPPERPLTLLQLVSHAGGFADDADRESVKVIRRLHGEARQYRVDVTEIEERGDLSSDVPLLPGDQVVVTQLPRLYVLGSVRRPGGYPFSSEERMTVAKAVSLAGGFRDGADSDRLTLLRDTPEGQTVYRINFAALTRNRRVDANVFLRPNDTLVVPQRDKVYVLGQVQTPGAFDLGERGLTVTQAIALAQGFTRIASPNYTILVRETEEGRRSFTVPVSNVINQGLQDQDARLRPGDIIFVPESVF